MSKAKLTYLGESGTHYILKIEDDDGFIGIGQIRKCYYEWAKKYYYDELDQSSNKTGEEK